MCVRQVIGNGEVILRSFLVDVKSRSAWLEGVQWSRSRATFPYSRNIQIYFRCFLNLPDRWNPRAVQDQICRSVLVYPEESFFDPFFPPVAVWIPPAWRGRWHGTHQGSSSVLGSTSYVLARFASQLLQNCEVWEAYFN